MGKNLRNSEFIGVILPGESRVVAINNYYREMIGQQQIDFCMSHETVICIYGETNRFSGHYTIKKHEQLFLSGPGATHKLRLEVALCQNY